MDALNQISDILRAMGARPETITTAAGETVIKVNAPQITRKSCDTCARRTSCKKDIGIIWGYCNTDYQREDMTK